MNKLPKNIVALYELMWGMCRQDDDFEGVDNEKLPYPLKYIRWDYPVTCGPALQVHELEEPVTTLYELILAIKKNLKADYDAGMNVAPHVFEDYTIEIIEIHPNTSFGGLATVYFGS